MSWVKKKSVITPKRYTSFNWRWVRLFLLFLLLNLTPNGSTWFHSYRQTKISRHECRSYNVIPLPLLWRLAAIVLWVFPWKIPKCPSDCMSDLYSFSTFYLCCLPRALVLLPKYVPDNIRHFFWHPRRWICSKSYHRTLCVAGF